MTEPQLVVADIRSHRAELLELNLEYMSWIFSEVGKFFEVPCAEIVGMPAPAYVEAVIDKVCDRQPPEGIFYLVTVEGQLVGMGGLRGLNVDLAEVKRLYVRPAFRGRGLGERVLARLLTDARTFGYRQACLESAPFMEAAHRLYERASFVDRSPYEGAEVPVEFHHRWHFMERPLTDVPTHRSSAEKGNA